MQFTNTLLSLAGLASVASALGTAATGDATTTLVVTEFTTYCPEATTFVFKNSTITVTEATTLTITDCPCTLKCYTPPPVTTTETPKGTVPFSNGTTTATPVVVTITYPPTTVLEGATGVTTKTGAVTPVGPTTKATTATGAGSGSTTTSTPAAVTAGSNKVGSGAAAALGLAVGVAALVL